MVPKLTELSASNHSMILDIPPWIPPKSKPTTLSISATFLPLTKPSKFDAVILLEIYAAREIPIEGISSDVLLKRIKSKYKFLSEKSELSSLIKDIGFKINITLGAGDIANEVEQIKSELEYAI